MQTINTSQIDLKDSHSHWNTQTQTLRAVINLIIIIQPPFPLVKRQSTSHYIFAESLLLCNSILRLLVTLRPEPISSTSWKLQRISEQISFLDFRFWMFDWCAANLIVLPLLWIVLHSTAYHSPHLLRDGALLTPRDDICNQLWFLFSHIAADLSLLMSGCKQDFSFHLREWVYGERAHSFSTNVVVFIQIFVCCYVILYPEPFTRDVFL